jgi:hypothetical protein
MYATYKCEETGETIEVKKQYGKDWPKSVKRDGNKFIRWFASVPVIDVAEGLHGNAANGYTSSSSTYQPSKFTPLKQVYGSVGRMAGAESE